MLVLSLTLAALGPLGDTPPVSLYRPAMERIRERELRAWLGFLAAPELEGRASGTRGYDVASRYVSSVLASHGVAPAGRDGSYYQRFTLVRRRRLAEEAYVEVRGVEEGGVEEGGVEEGGVERIPLKGEVAVGSPRSVEWRGPWVFAGHGESCDRDGPDDFHGLPLEGRVVMILPRPGSLAAVTRGARAYGVRRLVVVAEGPVKRQVGMRFRDLPQYRIDRTDGPDGDVEVVYVSPKVADRILKRWGKTTAQLLDQPGRPPRFALEGAEIELKIELQRSELPTQNVLGYLKGSDPRLKGEVVLVGAHLDHVGARSGRVYHGADDNASGSVAVLAVARAFHEAARPPRRSVIFAFFGGEELGLHGSQFFVDHPTVSLDDVVLMVNLDMVGRNEERRSKKPQEVEKAEDNVNTLHVVGAKRLSRELEPWIVAVNRRVGFELEYDEERVFRRSDHYAFAARNVPVALLFSGFHPDYHQPTDTADKINFDKVVRASRLAFALAYEVADRERRLVINRF